MIKPCGLVFVAYPYALAMNEPLSELGGASL